jgi:hypothetical protein
VTYLVVFTCVINVLEREVSFACIEGLTASASREGQVKLRIVTAVLAAAALCVAAAGSAAAQPLARTSAPSRQVTGTQLLTAVLPPTDFVSSVASYRFFSSGGNLQSTRVRVHVPRLTCAEFELQIYASKFGDTATAALKYTNSNWLPFYPNVIIEGDEQAFQFATSAAAATFYDQALAKFSACTFYSSGHGSIVGAVTVDTLSIAKTTVNGDKAFFVIERVAEAGVFEGPLYFGYLYAVAGSNVYLLFELSGTTNEPSVTLMTDLMHRVQALYRHH